MKNFALSIIIPTRDRALVLRDTLESLPSACDGMEQHIECLIIDNGSTDGTQAVVERFSAIAPFSVRYVYEPCPGLHVGRNLGAQLAQAKILAYLDDDVLVQPGWANAIISRFRSDKRIGVVGGPCRPLWEAQVPTWIEGMKKEIPGGWYYSGLSVIDMGDAPTPTSFQNIFGCNFCIRKSVLMEAGGFHPDGMPDALLHFRGDGEDAVAKYVESNQYTIFYDPAVFIKHRIPASRLTPEHILRVSTRSGISMGYTAYREAAKRGIFFMLREALRHASFLLRSNRRYAALSAKCKNNPCDVSTLSVLAANRFSAKHFLRIFFNPGLAKWVLQPTYFAEDPCPYKK